MLTMLIIIGSHVAGGRRFCSVAFFMPPIFVFNLYSDYIRRKSARQESSTTVWRTKAASSHGHFRLAVTVLRKKVLPMSMDENSALFLLLATAGLALVLLTSAARPAPSPAAPARRVSASLRGSAYAPSASISDTVPARRRRPRLLPDTIPISHEKGLLHVSTTCSSPF